MRVAIPHNLPPEEVRRRLRDNIGDLASHIPGGMATVESNWASDDRMMLNVSAMGQTVAGRVDVEPHQVTFELTLPPALSFFEPLIDKALKQQGQKLLAP